MDLIAIMAALFLNLSTGCDALKADVMRVGGQDYYAALDFLFNLR